MIRFHGLNHFPKFQQIIFIIVVVSHALKLHGIYYLQKSLQIIKSRETTKKSKRMNRSCFVTVHHPVIFTIT